MSVPVGVVCVEISSKEVAGEGFVVQKGIFHFFFMGRVDVDDLHAGIVKGDSDGDGAILVGHFDLGVELYVFPNVDSHFWFEVAWREEVV